jgi:hypothetical protein
VVGVADYLDALSPRDSSRRGFAALGAPLIGTPGIYDSEMWTLDVRWAPPRSSESPPAMSSSALSKSATKAMWSSYVQCVRVAEVGGGWISQPWSVTGAALCTNPAGVRQAPKCPWGMWRMPMCDAQSISLAWQGTRYLWAQQKMRELLSQTPTRDDAAQWVWSAYQLISLLHWSTNVRFGNPQAHTFDYARELERAGCIAPGFGGINTARVDGQMVARSTTPAGLSFANWNRMSEADDNFVRPERGPGVLPPLVPTSRGDFSPWFELASGFRDPATLESSPALPPSVAAVVALQRSLVGSRRGWSRTLALRGADAEAPSPAFAMWMRETWGQEQITVPFPLAARPSFALTFAAASQIVSRTRRALEHYVGVPFLKWQTTILDVYTTEVAPFVLMLPGETRLAWTSAVRDFAGRAAQAQAAEWNSGEVAAYTTTAMTLIASLVNSGAGAILGAMFTLLNYLVRFLGDAGLMASGYSVCPSFPFIRVPDPPCNALGPPVDAVGLPLEVPPGPIMLTPTQVATLRARSRAGLLTPEQRAMLVQPIVLAPGPSTSSGGSAIPILGAAALLALLFSRR